MDRKVPNIPLEDTYKTTSKSVKGLSQVASKQITKTKTSFRQIMMPKMVCTQALAVPLTLCVSGEVCLI